MGVSSAKPNTKKQTARHCEAGYGPNVTTKVFSSSQYVSLAKERQPERINGYTYAF